MIYIQYEINNQINNLCSSKYAWEDFSYLKNAHGPMVDKILVNDVVLTTADKGLGIWFHLIERFIDGWFTSTYIIPC